MIFHAREAGKKAFVGEVGTTEFGDGLSSPAEICHPPGLAGLGIKIISGDDI